MNSGLQGKIAVFVFALSLLPEIGLDGPAQTLIVGQVGVQNTSSTKVTAPFNRSDFFFC